MPTAITNLVVDRVDLVDAGANQEAHVALFKRHTNEGDAPVADTETIEMSKAEADEVAAYVADLEKLATEAPEFDQDEADAIAKYVADLEALAAPEPTDEDLFKGLDPAVIARIEKAEAANTEQAEKLAKMEDASATAEAVNLAKSLPLALGEDLADVVKVAKRDLDEATFDSLFDALSKADKRISEGDLLKERGSSNATIAGGTAIEKAKAAAGEGESHTDVFARDADLYAEYQAELEGA